MEFDSNTVKRLAFIKYLYHQALSLSLKPEPISASSILMFHDSVELFLRLASELFDDGGSHINFMEYWELLSPHISTGTLPQKESMRRLNKSRVNLKHHGAFPSKLDIESYRATVNSFFEKATPLVFEIDFDEVSLVDFVELEEAKQHLHKATKAVSENNFGLSIEHSSTAFRMILDDFEESKREGFRSSPFSFGDELVYLDPRFVDNFSDCFDGFEERFQAEQFEHNLKEYLDKIKNQ